MTENAARSAVRILSENDGNKHGNNCPAEEYDLGNYPWDTVEMELCFTRRTYLQAPLALATP